MDSTGSNAEQSEYWNGPAARTWVEREPEIDTLIRPLGLHAIERADVRAGQRVLDVGCGAGSTTQELARRVGVDGEVLGIDLSGPLLEVARRRGVPPGAGRMRFEQADAQSQRLPAAYFDLLFSRFGVMFFADPVAAFANLRGALAPTGRLSFVCWQGLERNAWMRVPLLAALKHLPPPAPPQPGAPGPFAFADPGRVSGILEGAGFANVSLESLERDLLLGMDLDRACAFALEVGPVGRALREADPSLAPVVAAEVRAALADFQGERGICVPSAAWLVSARPGGGSAS